MNSNEDRAEIRLTRAHLLRHLPRGAGSQGQEAVLVDVAQDLLLRELHRVGLMHDLVFKGGTALRKLYAGNAGRSLSTWTSASGTSAPEPARSWTFLRTTSRV